MYRAGRKTAHSLTHCMCRCVGPGKRRAPGNGLRQFSLSVLQMVEKKGRTSYNEVADELVKESESYYNSKGPRVSACNVLLTAAFRSL